MKNSTVVRIAVILTILVALFGAGWMVSPEVRAQTTNAVDIFYRSVAMRGDVLMLGNEIEFDVDGDTKISAATDDQLNIAVGGSNSIALTSSGVAFTDDVSLTSDTGGGNAGTVVEFIGVPRIARVATAVGTNGSTETASYMDATPTGEWSEVDAGTNLVVTADTSYYKDVTNSIKIAFTAVVTDDGIVGTAGSQDDLSSNESIGFWIYSTVALTSGDFALTIDDSDGTDQVYVIGAVVANIWTWIELDISGCDANCDTMDNIKVLVTAQGAGNLTSLDLYIDAMYKWDATDEEALGLAIQPDGLIAVEAVLTANTGVNTVSILAEYTDYFINYENGVDFFVWITDQSANSCVSWVAY
jgi:hypothetical protein